jgi:ubiquinone/menaquinone biosynthesis C-methylase UbiE
MFSKSAKFYNAIYGSIGKDHAAEAQEVHQIIQQYKRSPGNTLLEVACGTGLHAAVLQKYYKVDGLDLDAEMLAVASQNFPQIPFHQADMADFDWANNLMPLPACSAPSAMSNQSGWQAIKR